ncbi:hypothetical protein [Halosegnis longus]|uniref:hypothetical protein n=1 Tax=Halosegnis longus TaxID=2216012 RepID=UPI00129DE969|nr:hypothetical protein [Halosegnis longus]
MADSDTFDVEFEIPGTVYPHLCTALSTRYANTDDDSNKSAIQWKLLGQISEQFEVDTPQDLERTVTLTDIGMVHLNELKTACRQQKTVLENNGRDGAASTFEGLIVEIDDRRGDHWSN